MRLTIRGMCIYILNWFYGLSLFKNNFKKTYYICTSACHAMLNKANTWIPHFSAQKCIRYHDLTYCSMPPAMTVETHTRAHNPGPRPRPGDQGIWIQWNYRRFDEAYFRVCLLVNDFNKSASCLFAKICWLVFIDCKSLWNKCWGEWLVCVYVCGESVLVIRNCFFFGWFV